MSENCFSFIVESNIHGDDFHFFGRQGSWDLPQKPLVMNFLRHAASCQPFQLDAPGKASMREAVGDRYERLHRGLAVSCHRFRLQKGILGRALLRLKHSGKKLKQFKRNKSKR